jgi:hypothetical protein
MLLASISQSIANATYDIVATYRKQAISLLYTMMSVIGRFFAK